MSSKRVRINFYTAIMAKASVYDKGVRIGSTFIYYNEMGSQVQELVRDDGTIIPPGWFDLRMEDIEPKLIVVARTKQ